jgi:hypothetical protein
MEFWVVNGNPQAGPHQFAGATGTAKYFATTNPNGTPIFTAPTPGTFNLETNIRDIIYGPGFQDWNLSLFKRFPINERNGFEFRAEAYDVWNHPNWAGTNDTSHNGPNFNPTAGTFGEVIGKSNLARELQLSLRYQF